MIENYEAKKKDNLIEFKPGERGVFVMEYAERDGQKVLVRAIEVFDEQLDSARMMYNQQIESLNRQIETAKNLIEATDALRADAANSGKKQPAKKGANK